MNPRTRIDWVAGTSRDDGATVTAAAADLFKGPLRIRDRDRGHLGYLHSANLLVGVNRVGLICWGGKHQRGWVYLSLNAAGCALVTSWEEASARLNRLRDWRFNRVDVAFDTFHGEISHQSVMDAYDSGGFRGKGRPPMRDVRIGNPPYGARTVAVGVRTADKYVRAYEKGVKMKSRAGSLEPLSDADRNWYRLELEFKSKRRVIPGDMLVNPDQHFANAYPFFEETLRTLPADADVSSEPALLIAGRFARDGPESEVPRSKSSKPNARGVLL